MARMPARETQPRVFVVRKRTVAKVDSIGFTPQGITIRSHPVFAEPATSLSLPQLSVSLPDAVRTHGSSSRR